MHTQLREYVPSLLFGRLLTSSNFDDMVKATTGGRNGFGAKLCNAYSREFEVETQCGESGLRYRRIWSHNMSTAGEPQISACSGPDFTRVTFKPDLARFGVTCLDVDICALIGRRAYDLAATCPGVSVHLNGRRVPVRGFRQYCEMYAPPGAVLAEAVNKRWHVAACASIDASPSAKQASVGFRHVSFVNSIATCDGGRHVDLLCERLLAPLTKAVKAALHMSGKSPFPTTPPQPLPRGGRKKAVAVEVAGDGEIGGWPPVTPAQVRQRLWLFCSCRVDNPSFESQAKRRLTLPTGKFGSAAAMPEALCGPESGFYATLANVNLSSSVGQAVRNAIVQQACPAPSVPAARVSRPVVSALPADGSAVVAALSQGKLQHANLAVNRRGDARSPGCVLVLTEGDSAKALAVAGSALLPGGRDRYGVLALRGKLINTRDVETEILERSQVLRLLCDVVGLQIGKHYATSAELNGLRYQQLLIMADQDIDGTHIKGLLLNLIHCFWPELLRKQLDFVRLLVTPVAKATPPGSGGGAVEFYSTEEINRWRAVTPNWHRWSVKFYKGLGAFTTAESRMYFNRLAEQCVRFVRREADCGGAEDDAALDLAFGWDADARKAWITERASLDAETAVESELPVGELPYQRPDNGDIPELSCHDFVHRELIQFSLACNRRGIPCLMDGLKPSQRKILFACLKRRLFPPRQMRVTQLGGSVVELTAYYHGDKYIYDTMIGMAQNFVGSNNINLLLPHGQFGSRLQGGNDAASPRYISTSLSPLSRLIYHPDDDPLLSYRVESGEQVEPVWFAPVVPMVLINGAEGIGVGWNTRIPNYSLPDVLANLRRMLSGKPPVDMLPSYRGFTGSLRRVNEQRYVSYGRVYNYGNSGVFEITELPLRVWSNAYANRLKSLAVDVNNYCSDSRVQFLIRLSPEQMASARKAGLYKYLRLWRSDSYQSMVLADKEGRIRRHLAVKEILQEYFDIRMDLYIKRHSSQVLKLDAKLRYLSNQTRFTQEVSDGRLRLGSLQDREAVLRRLVDAGFETDPLARAEAAASTADSEVPAAGEGDDAAGERDFGYLLRLSVWSLTLERQQRLLRERDEAEDRLQRMRRLSPADLWLADLAELEAADSAGAVGGWSAGAAGGVRTGQLAEDAVDKDTDESPSAPPSNSRRVAHRNRRAPNLPGHLPVSQFEESGIIQIPSGVPRTFVPPPRVKDPVTDKEEEVADS